MLDLKLIEAERPKDDAFKVKLSDDTIIELRSPKELRASDLIGFTLDNPVLALQTILGDTFEQFITDDLMTVYAMERIFTDWATQYGLQVDQGEDSASRTSSTGTARPSRRTSGSPRKAKVS